MDTKSLRVLAQISRQMKEDMLWECELIFHSKTVVAMGALPCHFEDGDMSPVMEFMADHVDEQTHWDGIHSN